MNQLELVKEKVLATFPTATGMIDAPIDPNNPWFLDFALGSRTVVVVWTPLRGFGISSRQDIGYGEGSDELISDPDAVINRVSDILKLDRDTAPSL
jgi:hypothetical protein